MANSIKTDALSTLSQATALEDTDLIPVGASKGAALKTVQWSKIKEKIPTFVLEFKDVDLSASTSYASGSLNIEKSGYTPVAISGWQASDSANVVPGKMMISSANTLYYIFRKVNYSSGSWTGTATIRILYVKAV